MAERDRLSPAGPAIVPEVALLCLPHSLPPQPLQAGMETPSASACSFPVVCWVSDELPITATCRGVACIGKQAVVTPYPSLAKPGVSQLFEGLLCCFTMVAMAL